MAHTNVTDEELAELIGRTAQAALARRVLLGNPPCKTEGPENVWRP